MRTATKHETRSRGVRLGDATRKCLLVGLAAILIAQMGPAGVVGSHTQEHNNAPVVPAIPDASTSEDVALTVTITASDPDGDDIQFELIDKPDGAQFHQDTPTSAKFEWTPSFEQAGDYNMTVRVWDEYEGTLRDFNVSVANTNRAPVLDFLSNEFIDELESIHKQWNANDPDGDLVTMTLEGNGTGPDGLPAGLGFQDGGAGQAALSWTPDCTQGSLPYPGTQYHFWANATDGTDSSSREFDIFVLDVDTAPSVNPVPHHKAFEGDLLSFTINATSCDEGEALFAEVGFVGAVSLTGFNPPPLPSPTPNQLLPVGVSVSPEDPDAMLFDAVSGDNYTVFTWNVGEQQGGNYTFYANIRDSAGNSDNTTFTVFINVTNTPPQLVMPPFHVPAEQLYYGKEDTRFYATLPLNAVTDVWEATVVDLENDVVAWQLDWTDVTGIQVPDGMVVDTPSQPVPASQSYLRISWVPTYEQAGNYSFSLRVTDGDTADFAYFNISVENTNRLPRIDPIPDFAIPEGQELLFDIDGQDWDMLDSKFPDLLELTADDGFGGAIPPGSDFQDDHARQGTWFQGGFSWTPSFFQAGSYTVRITADDSDNDRVDPANPLTGPLINPPVSNPVELTTITVTNVDRPPVVTIPCAPLTVMHDTPLSMGFKFSDPDFDLITIANETPLPGFLTLTDNGDGSGDLSGTPTISDLGTYTMVINATSGPNAWVATTTCVLNVVGNAEFSLKPVGSSIVHAAPGVPLTVSVNVTNEILYGDDTISFVVDEGTEGATATVPAAVTLGPGNSTIVTFDITVPAGENDFVVKLRGVSTINPGYVEPKTQSGFIVRVPVFTDTVMTNTLPLPSITGLVEATYVDGSPAVGHDVVVTQRPWYDLFGHMATSVAGTTDASGLFSFDFGTEDVFASAPDAHILTVEVEEYGWAGPEETGYTVGL